MQTFKKIGLGLFYVAIAFAGFNSTALAANLPKNFSTDPNPLFAHPFVYKNGQIQTTIIDTLTPGQPSYDLNFTQNSKNKLEYDSTQQYFCASNVARVAAPAKITLSKAPSGNSFQGNLSAYVMVQGGNCKSFTNNPITIQNQDTGSGGRQGLPTTITYNNNTYHQIANSTLYGISTNKGTDCYGGSVILTNATGTSGTAFLGLIGNGGSVPLQPSLKNAGAPESIFNLTLGCGFQDPTAKTDGYSGTITNGHLNAAVPDPSSSGTTAPDNSCEASYTGAAHTLNWLFCSILEGVDSMFNTIYHTISSQLNICTGKSSTTGDTCSNNLLTPQVEKSWAVFRDLATALLVIIMLIMVFAQAINFGPLDAYTVRKVLPRLVAMAILIQVSWPMLKFLVDLSNDLGYGIQQIMLAPFGGSGKLAFDNQIGQVGVAAPGLTITAGAVFTGAVLAFSGITIFGWLLIGVSAVISVLVGLLVILFRQMLIILAIMVAPLAFIAYVLPGTQQYWKIWKDNFTKLLLMFPLIMAMIAGGKIFASVGANTGNFLGLIVVLVGFVGPLWFLPKTFKWGGSLFAAAANGAWNSSKRLRNAPGKFAFSQAETNRRQREQDRHERLSYGRGRLFDRAISRAGDIGLTAKAAQIREAKHLAEGREAGEKAVAQEVVGSEYEAQDHGQKLVTLDYLAQGETDPATGLDGSNPAMQRWALDQLATFGDWDRIDGLRSSGNLDERVWQQFMAKNISAVHQNAPYLSPLRRDMSQLGYHEAASWKDHAVHEFERQILTGQIRTADGQGYEDAPDQQRQLALGVDFATRALADDRIRANLSADAIATFERIRDLASPEVRVTRLQGGQVRANLPSPLLLQNNPAARESLTSHLVSPDQATRQATQQAVVGRLADPELDTHSREVMEDFIVNFRMQAQASGSPEIINSYNQILNDWNRQLANRPRDAERAAIARGEQGPAIVQARTNAQTEADNERSRLLAAGLTPIVVPGNNPNNPPAGGP